MRWRSVLSLQHNLEAGVRECLDRLRDFPRPIDLAVVFVDFNLRRDSEAICQRLRRELGARLMIGCTGGGVIGDGCEVEHRAALSVSVAQFEGVDLHGFTLEQDDLPSPDAPPESWREAIGVPVQSDCKAVLLFADAFDFSVEPLLGGLDYAFPGATVLGGLASAARRPGGNRLFLNHQSLSRGLVGVALSGDIKVDAVVAQGCRGIGVPMLVTAVHENRIVELDNEPALVRLDRLLRELKREDRALAETSLFLGIQRPNLSRSQSSPVVLVRNLIGVDPARAALVVDAPMRVGQTVQFQLRDADAARADLERVLSRFAEENSTPQAALLFTCLGRGEYLYKKASYDSEQFLQRFPGVPVFGFFGNGEIGPVGGQTYLHGYTSCFAVFSEP